MGAGTPGSVGDLGAWDSYLGPVSASPVPSEAQMLVSRPLGSLWLRSRLPAGSACAWDRLFLMVGSRRGDEVPKHTSLAT